MNCDLSVQGGTYKGKVEISIILRLIPIKFETLKPPNVQYLSLWVKMEQPVWGGKWIRGR
jgi:hypothetical protein